MREREGQCVREKDGELKRGKEWNQKKGNQRGQKLNWKEKEREMETQEKKQVSRESMRATLGDGQIKNNLRDKSLSHLYHTHPVDRLLPESKQLLSIPMPIKDQI